MAQHIQSLPQATPLRISAITLGEIEYGLAVRSGDSTAWQAALRAFIEERLPMVLDIRKTTRLYYGDIRARLFEKYAPREKRRRRLRPEQLINPATSRELGIQENDLWLVAQALEFHLVLVTNDAIQQIRDLCEELRVENWTG